MIGMLILIPVIGIPATVAYFQETNAGLIFIEEAVRRQVFGWDIPASAFVAMDGLFCFTLVPAMIALWKWQERRGREPGEQGKIAIGYLLTALASLPGCFRPPTVRLMKPFEYEIRCSNRPALSRRMQNR